MMWRGRNDGWGCGVDCCWRNERKRWRNFGNLFRIVVVVVVVCFCLFVFLFQVAQGKALLDARPFAHIDPEDQLKTTWQPVSNKRSKKNNKTSGAKHFSF